MTIKIGIRAWVDFAFRKIFGKPGNENCIISLLNAVLDLPAPVVSVEFLNPFSYKDFEDDKLVCVDVKATDQIGRVFIVEIQIVIHSGFAKRAVFYACKAYTEQLFAGQGYGDLRATYSICFLMRRLWDDDQLHHHFQLVERSSQKHLEDSIEIHTVELSKYNKVSSAIRNASLLDQWIYWIKNANEHSVEELLDICPGSVFAQATKELKEIQEITVEKQMYDSREKAALDYKSNLIDARQEGRQEGRREGEAIGKVKTYQELLGIKVSSDEELSSVNSDLLASMIAELQARLRLRLG